nr:unnamed protein product [Haemonchus contortus]
MQVVKAQNKVDALTPFLIFFVVGFLFGIFLAFLHVSMTKNRLSSKRTEKKRKPKKSKKGKEKKGKGKEKKKGKKKK